MKRGKICFYFPNLYFLRCFCYCFEWFFLNIYTGLIDARKFDRNENDYLLRAEASVDDLTFTLKTFSTFQTYWKFHFWLFCFLRKRMYQIFCRLSNYLQIECWSADWKFIWSADRKINADRSIIYRLSMLDLIKDYCGICG